MAGPPDLEPIGLFVTRRARALSRAFDDALADAGGTLPTWLVLASLKGARHGTQRHVAADVGIEGATLTHHLTRMEAAGLVTRARDARDRRAQVVELTDAGETEFRTLLSQVLAFDNALRAGFTDEELATLRTLVDRLVANATRYIPTEGAPT
ncbi:MAG TPA: MarR family winged helix-turn-helix transcriptional regulator [Acidimicrobiales bacterium]|nr:MarR family winged helix-turn-helix transcriptional regulator [Acidimicrobiales bacterium]